MKEWEKWRISYELTWQIINEQTKSNIILLVANNLFFLNVDIGYAKQKQRNHSKYLKIANLIYDTIIFQSLFSPFISLTHTYNTYKWIWIRFFVVVFYFVHNTTAICLHWMWSRLNSMCTCTMTLLIHRMSILR